MKWQNTRGLRAIIEKYVIQGNHVKEFMSGLI